MPAFLLSLLPALLAVLLFVAAIEWLVGWLTILNSWQQLPVSAQLLALPLLMASYLLRAWRNYDYFNERAHCHWWRCLYVTVIHNALNSLLPLRSGELSFPLLMRRHLGLRYRRTVPALLLMRLMDAAVLALLALLVSSSGHACYWMPLLLLPFACFPLRASLLRLLRPWRRARLPRRLIPAITGLPRQFGSYCRCYLLTWLNWGVKLGLLAWLITSFTGLPVDHAFFGALGGELTSILPINPPGGLGSYQAGVLAGVMWWQPPSTVLLAAAVNIHLLLLGSSLLAALGATLIAHGLRHAQR